MTKRLKVLMSAYACEPGKGSEPEVGWQWALQMARHHDVTVLTRANNRPNIEPAIESLRSRQPVPRFVYHDRSEGLLRFKHRFNAVQLYYILWQKSAHELVRRLHTENGFDLLHHVTFAGFRYPTALWGHGVPVIWGPIGGIESIPMELLPWKHPRSLVHEIVRNANNLIQAAPFHVLPKRAGASTMVLVSTPEMKRTLARFGFQAEMMPTIGLIPGELPYREHKPNTGPLELLFVGSIITLKGVDLALEALAKSGTNARLTFIGSGRFESAARRLATSLGLNDRIRFLGRLPRQQVLEAYADYDAFLFPSLHDTGGYAVIEAMLYELPVICLDCGGPAVAVQPGCGVKVPLGPRAAVIEALAQAIGMYEENRSLATAHGKASRRHILETYDWSRKAQEMNRKYEEAVSRPQADRLKKYSGMGGVANLLHQLFSMKGVLVTALVLLLIGTVGVLSVGHLKRQAALIVTDTLPGLSAAGEANASLAQGFNRTMLMLVTPEPEQRDELRKEINAYSDQTARHLEAYRSQIFQPEEGILFRRWVAAREQYLQIRERAIAVLSTNQPAALELCKRELLPAYGRYREIGDTVFQYNMREGQSRGERIMVVCTVTQWVVAGIGIAVFLLGFAFGFFR